jgi:hypothetical protein
MKKKKKLSNLNLKDKVKDDVIYLEKLMYQTVDSIWVDDIVISKYKSILNLDIDERRLYLVYIILNESIKQTALYFKIDRKTVSYFITEIKNKLNQNQ